MPRDYKNRTTGRRRRTRRKSSPWAWLATGLAIGMFTALLVFLKYRNPEFIEASEAFNQNNSPLNSREVRKTGTQDNPSTLAPKTPRFEFYKTLPEMEIIIPETNITGNKKNGIKQISTPGTYLLQAGSFRNHAQADKLRAKLALRGLETTTQSTDNEDEWHRVRVGPFDNLQQLNKIRSELKKMGIDAIVIRLKEKT